MAKKKTKKIQKKQDPNVLEEVEQEITFNCPIRGKVVQKVKVKKLKPKGDGGEVPVIPDSDLTSKIDSDSTSENDEDIDG
jgi:hypothetical protein